MFKRRQQEQRRGLVERARPFIAGEEPRAFAFAQGADPRWHFAPVFIGVMVVNSSLIGSDNYLPTWMGWLGVALAIAATVGALFIRQRFVLRTDKHVYLFKRPRRSRDPVGPPLSVTDVVGLPSVRPDDRSQTVAGERLWPPYGSKIDRDALLEALMPAPPRS